MLHLSFNNNAIDSICTVLSISEQLLPVRENRSVGLPIRNGSYYTGYKYVERIIDVTLLLTSKSLTEMKSIEDTLSTLLNVDGPTKLECSRFEGYVYAVPDGNLDLKRVNNFTKTIDITFICNDPIIYSNEWKSFLADSKGVVEFINNSNLECYPSFSVNFKGNASFCQFTKRDGSTVLVGTPAHLVSPPVAPSPIIIENPCESTTGLSALADSLLPTGYTGNFSWKINHAGKSIIYDNLGSGEKWHGASAKINLPSQVGSFELMCDFNFTSDMSKFKPEPPAPNPPEAPPPVDNTTTNVGTYEVTANSGLNLRASANTTSKVLVTMPKGTKVYPSSISKNWAKCSYKKGTTTHTGYASMDYLKKISTSKILKNEVFIEEEVGTLNLFGYTADGIRLFEFEIQDTSEWFEHASPKLVINGRTVLNDNTINGKKVKTKKNDDGVVENIASGAVGDWNNLKARLFIEKIESDGGSRYTVSIVKIVNGNINDKTLKNTFTTNSKEKLAYLGLFCGAFGSKVPKTVMQYNHIRVKNLTDFKPEIPNLQIFRAGDELNIDFATGDVTLNGKNFLENVDIGSEFFGVEQGNNDVIVRADASIDITAGIRENKI